MQPVEPIGPVQPVQQGDTAGTEGEASFSATQPADVAIIERASGGAVLGWLERRGIRIDPGRRGALAVGLAALIAAVLAGWWLFVGRPHASPLRPALGSSSAASTVTTPAEPPGSPSRTPAARRSVPANGGAPAGGTSSPTSAPAVVVDVAGKVRHPGIYRLPAGSRVDGALRAAGGALPGVDLSGLNLARKVSDGEQIAVGVRGAAPPAVVGSPAPNGTAGGAGAVRVDLNTATAAQLDTLPGVGPVLAQHILDWRAAHGRFDSVDQLRDVSGIGPAKFADLRSLVTL